MSSQVERWNLKDAPVRITKGPFKDFTGVVAKMDIGAGKVRLIVKLLNRPTPVELDFAQVERL